MCILESLVENNHNGDKPESSMRRKYKSLNLFLSDSLHTKIHWYSINLGISIINIHEIKYSEKEIIKLL